MSRLVSHVAAMEANSLSSNGQKLLLASHVDYYCTIYVKFRFPCLLLFFDPSCLNLPSCASQPPIACRNVCMTINKRATRHLGLASFIKIKKFAFTEYTHCLMLNWHSRGWLQDLFHVTGFPVRCNCLWLGQERHPSFTVEIQVSQK